MQQPANGTNLTSQENSLVSSRSVLPRSRAAHLLVLGCALVLPLHVHGQELAPELSIPPQVTSTSGLALSGAMIGTPQVSKGDAGWSDPARIRATNQTSAQASPSEAKTSAPLAPELSSPPAAKILPTDSPVFLDDASPVRAVRRIQGSPPAEAGVTALDTEVQEVATAPVSDPAPAIPPAPELIVPAASSEAAPQELLQSTLQSLPEIPAAVVIPEPAKAVLAPELEAPASLTVAAPRLEDAPQAVISTNTPSPVTSKADLPRRLSTGSARVENLKQTSTPSAASVLVAPERNPPDESQPEQSAPAPEPAKAADEKKSSSLWHWLRKEEAAPAVAVSEPVTVTESVVAAPAATTPTRAEKPRRNWNVRKAAENASAPVAAEPVPSPIAAPPAAPLADLPAAQDTASAPISAPVLAAEPEKSAPVIQEQPEPVKAAPVPERRNWAARKQAASPEMVAAVTPAHPPVHQDKQAQTTANSASRWSWLRKEETAPAAAVASEPAAATETVVAATTPPPRTEKPRRNWNVRKSSESAPAITAAEAAPSPIAPPADQTVASAALSAPERTRQDNPIATESEKSQLVVQEQPEPIKAAPVPERRNWAARKTGRAPQPAPIQDQVREEMATVAPSVPASPEPKTLSEELTASLPPAPAPAKVHPSALGPTSTKTDKSMAADLVAGIKPAAAPVDKPAAAHLIQRPAEEKPVLLAPEAKVEPKAEPVAEKSAFVLSAPVMSAPVGQDTRARPSKPQILIAPEQQEPPQALAVPAVKQVVDPTPETVQAPVAPVLAPAVLPPVIESVPSPSDVSGKIAEAVATRGAEASMIGSGGRIPLSEEVKLGLWVAERGVTLRAALQDWCDKAGAQLVWRSEYDYPLAATISVDGDFEGAIRTLLAGFAGAQPQPVGRLHRQSAAGGYVLIITSRGNSGGE